MTAATWLLWALAQLTNPTRRQPRYRGVHRASRKRDNA